MTVYIILEDFGCEGYEEPVMVFDSKEKANAYVAENAKNLYCPVIVEKEVV